MAGKKIAVAKKQAKAKTKKTEKGPAQRRNVVIFADDQPRWHKHVERTKESKLPKLKNILTNCEIRSAADADELMEAIRKALDEVDVDLIFVFLDLNFPDIQTGLATLNRLRRNSDDRVRQIPVFVYSISKDQSEVAAVQTRGGNGYFHKVDHPDTFWEALQTIDRSDASQWPRPGQAADVIKGRRPANDLASAQFLQ